MKKTLQTLLFALIAIMMPIGAWAQTSTIDLFTLTATYVISDSEEYTFTGSGKYGIKVESGNPRIILNNTSITVDEGSAIDVASGSNATIFVLGDNTIGTTKTESWDAPCGGIFVAEGGTVNITSNGTDNILRAHGTLAAAIGGKYVYDNNESYNAGSINISNVTVYAYTNNFYASAIGAAGVGTCGTINITNAVVYAYGAGDEYTSAPGIGSAWSLVGCPETIPIVMISGSEIHTFRYNSASDYIGYLGDVDGNVDGSTFATGSINCGEGGSVKSSTIYCYTGLDATTTDKTVKYGALGSLLVEDENGNWVCEGEHTYANGVCANCGYKCTHEGGEHTTAIDNGDGTHSFTCSICGEVTEEHTPDESYTANGNVIMVSCSECHGTVGTATITAENTTYNGTAQETATVAYSEGWNSGELTVSYANNTNAGTATASITVGEATASVEFTIAKAEVDLGTLVDPEFATGLVYNGTAQALVIKTGSVEGGTILYSLTYDGEYTSTIPVATEAGRYGVYWLIQGDENHEDILSPGWTQVIIAKAASSITTAPSGKELTYKGYAQALVTAGEAMGGTILYSLDNATWNEEIPVGKEIGDYTVYYKVIGDNNHDDIATQSVTVAIKACEHSYNEDGFCEMCSTANPDETMFFIFDGDHKAFNVAEDLVGVNIEYTRGLHNTEWNSLYLPFEVPVTEELLDEFEFAYVNDMHSADTDDNGEIDKIEMEIVKIKEGTLHANHPYFIRAKSEYTILQLSYENTTLHATKETTLNCSSIYMDYAIVGTYKHIKGTEFASMPADRYYAISIDGGWWQIPEDSSLYPFRAYLSMTARDGSPVKVSDEAMRSIRIREKGEGTTGIEEVKGENGEVKTIYDLQGRRVEVPNKGLYIINGKKVLIK